MQREVGINKERRKRQGDRKGRGNKTQESMMVKEKSGKNDGQEKLREVFKFTRVTALYIIAHTTSHWCWETSKLS